MESKHSKGRHSYLEHCNRKKAAVGRKQLSTTDSNQGQRHRQTKGAYNEQLHARVNTGHAAANLQEKSAGYPDVVSRERRQPEDFPPWQFGFLGTGLLESLERPATVPSIRRQKLHRCIVCKYRLHAVQVCNSCVLLCYKALKQTVHRLQIGWSQPGHNYVRTAQNSFSSAALHHSCTWGALAPSLKPYLCGSLKRKTAIQPCQGVPHPQHDSAVLNLTTLSPKNNQCS